MKILTLNIGFYGEKHGVWEERKKLICEAVRKERPDVVALQAVRKNSRRNGSRSQAEELAKELGDYRDILFQGVMEHEDGVDGQAFLSRVPIRKTDFFPLGMHPDNQEDPYRRFVYYAVFDTETGPFHLYNSHFSWVDVQNEMNIREALGFIRETGEPAVIAGDFNAAPDKPSLGMLEKAGWRDLWKKLKGNDAGSTFESDRPSIRIDYLWANEAAAKRAIEIHVVSGETPGGSARFSDHLGLSALLG